MVPARGKALVKTDLSIAIPVGTYARVGEFSHSLTTTTMLVKMFAFCKGISTLCKYILSVKI
jgi:hypothetical protein